MSTLSNVRARLSPDAYDWLVSAIDPFHDFEHPIEGAPDAAIGRSYTRKFTQTATLACTADDDAISVIFTGCHGGDLANFYNAGVDGTMDGIPIGVTMAPIMALRSPLASGQPSLVKYITGTSARIASMFTRQVSVVPSRLVSLGVEIVDTTQSLYRRGTLCAAHMESDTQLTMLHLVDGAAGAIDATAFSPATLAITSTELTTHAGSYIGAAAKGIYLQGRLNDIQRPQQSIYKTHNTNTYGFPMAQPLLRTTDETVSGATYFIAPTVDQGAAVTVANFPLRSGWNESGFQPFVIAMTGLSVNSTFQLTVKCTVEYFPGAEHLFELGLATYSPCYEPNAFRLYHELMRQIPAGVPVSMNAAGDFWRMLVAAAKRVGKYAEIAAPFAIKAVEWGGTMAGRPDIAAAAKAANDILATAQRAKMLIKRPNRPLPPVPSRKRV